MCSGGVDLCLLQEKTQCDFTKIRSESIILQSPDFATHDSIRNRYFCIYNISLSCPASVSLKAKKAVTSPITNGTNCKDYLAIYTDNRGENIHQRKFCGDEITPSFKTQLPSGSFSMVLWTDKVDNIKGKFEFEVTCDLTLGETGSGRGSGEKTELEEEPEKSGCSSFLEIY